MCVQMFCFKSLQSIGSLTIRTKRMFIIFEDDNHADDENDDDDDVFSDCVEVLGVCRLVKAKCTAQFNA